VLSLVGDVIAAVALTVLVFQRTGSPFLAGLTFTLAFMPSLLGGTLLSALVDRLPPRRLMVTCDLVSAAMVIVMAAGHAPVYGAGLMAIQGLGFAAAGALAEVVSPHVAIVVAAGCGFTTIACFAPRRPAAV
jgi:MFS family permease